MTMSVGIILTIVGLAGILFLFFFKHAEGLGKIPKTVLATRNNLNELAKRRYFVLRRSMRKVSLFFIELLLKLIKRCRLYLLKFSHFLTLSFLRRVRRSLHKAHNEVKAHKRERVE